MTREPETDLYKTISNVCDAPDDSILIYNMEGGKGYVHRKDYDLFCRYYIETNSFPKYHTMDLAFAKYHSLILDIDFKGTYSPSDMSEYMTIYLKPTLKSIFDELPCFTYISATRPNGGLHIHLCELLISHDDYIQFCTQLQHRMNAVFPLYSVTLDIPINFNLSTACKPGTLPYKPFNICFMDQSTDICLPLSDSASFKQEHKKMKFKNKKNNSNSVFRKLIVYQYDQFMKEVLNCMMPYVVFPGIQSKKITYQTIISDETVTDYQPICHIQAESGCYSIFKSNKLNFKALDWFAVHNFLHHHGCKIQSLETKNHALNYWFDQMKSSTVTQNDIFLEVNKMIKDDNCNWRTDPNPLRTLMQYQDGLYFLPCFYALCRVMEPSPHEILHYFAGTSMDPLINRLKIIDERLLVDVAEQFTAKTLLYCASNMRIRQAENAFKTKSIVGQLDSVIGDMKETILQCNSKLKYEALIQTIISRHTPILVGIYKHSSKKPAKLLWNLYMEQWQDNNNEDSRNMVQTIHKQIEFFLEKNKKVDPFFAKVQIYQVAAVLSGVANFEREVIDMDRHKFHIKTRTGILDLLTGHVSSTVPEFFMSNKCINIPFDRREFNALYDHPELIRIYHLMLSKKFFRTFLRAVLTNVSDDYFDTLRIVSEEFGIYHDRRYPHLDSMLNFYCHLCKYMAFDYEMVRFMLYVLASIFIATNYYRRFFVFQGNTKNGKSKFFEMIERVFGSYSHSVRSINLHTSKSGTGPQPELASSLHSCRIIAVEELNGKIDENFIKELTGNSQVSCRNLYETNAGGIPTAKVFASTNNPPECTATDAFKDRVLAIPFTSSFSEQAPALLSQQVMENVYRIDLSDAVVRNSYVGMFVLSYCHLTQTFDRESGLLHLPPIPVVMTEFKDEYLKMTDIYAQFKQYVDLQIIANTKLLYNDLVSAVRKFLINTKSHLSLESQILKRFDDQYSKFKRESDVGYDFNSPLDEDPDAEDEEEEEEAECPEPAPKKLKCTTIYYQNVSIKQIKKRF